MRVQGFGFGVPARFVSRYFRGRKNIEPQKEDQACKLIVIIVISIIVVIIATTIITSSSKLLF